MRVHLVTSYAELCSLCIVVAVYVSHPQRIANHGVGRARNVNGRWTPPRIQMKPPTYADVLAAQQVVHRYLKPTLLYEWAALPQMLDCRFFAKHEKQTLSTALHGTAEIYFSCGL